MAYHPRENWNPQLRKRVYTRRDFLQRAALLGIALPALPSLLAACGRREDGATADLAIGTPASPVQQPLFDDNVAIESGLSPEAGPLLLYNWEAYMNPEIIPMAEEALGVEIQETTFVNEEEALARLSSGEVQFDVWFPTSQRVPVAVAASLIQPINHDYLTNLEANVWPQLADPVLRPRLSIHGPVCHVHHRDRVEDRPGGQRGHRGPGQPVGCLLEREVHRGDRDARLLHRRHTCCTVPQRNSRPVPGHGSRTDRRR